MSDAVRAALSTVIEGGTLDRDQAHRAMGAVMDGESTPAQLAALLVALRMRGETVDELAGFASAMRERVVRVVAPAGAMDIVATGTPSGVGPLEPGDVVEVEVVGVSKVSNPVEARG